MSRGPSAVVVVSYAQVYGAVLAVQAVVQAAAPAGEVWNVTPAMPRSDAAVADSVSVPRRFAPGSASETATVLKSLAVAKLVPGLAEAAVKSAPEAAAWRGMSATSAPRTRARSFTPA